MYKISKEEFIQTCKREFVDHFNTDIGVGETLNITEEDVFVGYYSNDDHNHKAILSLLKPYKDLLGFEYNYEKEELYVTCYEKRNTRYEAYDKYVIGFYTNR